MALDLSYIGSFFVERFQFFKKVTLSFLFLSLSLFASSLLANQGSQEITIDGTLYGDTGFSSPLLDPSATFKLQVLDPTKNCVLYEETQVVNTTTTSGRYNLRVGSLTGAGKRSGDDPNHAMIDIFQNVSALAATNAGCPGSTYTPSSGDGRFLRVTVTPSSTGVPETMSPDLALTSVANALVCESVQGLDRDKLAEFGTHINAAMTAANLLKLFDGSDVASLHNHDGEYAKLSNSNSIDLGTQQTIGFGEFTTAQETTLTGSLGAGDAGKTWYNSTTNKLMYWDGSAAQEIGSGGGSGAVTSVFGRTGVVTAAASDYDADQVDNTPAGNISATNVQAAITELDNEKLALSGGTMSGIINMNDNNLDMGTGTAKIVDLADPTNAQDAATKAYVDSAISTSGGSFVAKAGDTMTGALAMGTNKVTGVGDPTAAQDVATKNYVDTKLIGQALPSSPSTGQNGQALRWNNSGGAWEYYTPASGGLSDVVNDTTPQLGGTLDINGQNMSTATGFNIDITGSSSGNDFTVDTNKLVVEGDTGNVGLGTNSPASKLTISRNSNSLPTPLFNNGTETGLSHLAGSDSENTSLFIDSFAATANVMLRASAGTSTAPSALATDQTIGAIRAFGYGSTGYTATSRAAIIMGASENWTDSANGSFLSFQTTPNATNGQLEAVRITGDGNVGIGTTTPSGSLDVGSGSICLGGICRTTWPTGAGSGAFTDTGSLAHYTGGNVGIGTSSPTSKLHIMHGAGDVNLQLERHEDSTGGVAIAQRKARGTVGAPAVVQENDTLGGIASYGHDGTNFLDSSRIRMSVDGSVSTGVVPGRMEFLTQDSTGSFLERMRIDSFGNVGIGTASPGVTAISPDRTYLTIKGPSGVGVLELTSGGGDVEGNHSGLIQFSDSNSVGVNKRIAVITGSLEGPTAGSRGGAIRFFTRADNTDDVVTEKMRVGHNGNVGIGTTSPISALQVGELQDTTGDPGSKYLTVGGGHIITGHNNGALVLNASPDGTGEELDGIWFRSALNRADPSTATDLMRITGDGKVGIGTASPSNRLDVSGDGGTRQGIALAQTTAGTTWHINNYETTAGEGAGNFGINLGGSGQKLSILASNGNVGIGTHAPDQKLSVNGNASKVGGGSWATFSDRRLKTVHGPFVRGLKELLRLKPISYNYNDDNPLGIANGGDHIGFVAQEVEKVIPEAISYTEDGYLMIDNDPIIWTMLNAIKEVNGLCEMSQKQKKSLEKQVDNNEKKLELHQREIATLKAENKKLREEIQSIKKALVKLNLE